MKEKLKTVAIVLLLFSSIILFFINLGVNFDFYPNYRIKQSKKLVFDYEAILSDAVVPKSVGINFGDYNHTMLNNPKDYGFWGNSIELMQDIFSEDGAKIIKNDLLEEQLYLQLLKQKSIVYNFNEKVNLLTVLNAMGVENAKKIVEEYQNMDTLYVSLENPIVVISSEGLYHILIFDSLNTNVVEISFSDIEKSDYSPYFILADRYDSNSFEYVPIASKQKIEKITFKNILKTLDTNNIENIVYNFLGKEVNYVREIKVEDEHTIYSDGDEVLIIGENGLIDYTNPDVKQVKDRNLFVSLETALSFISNNLGYDSSLYLKNIIPIDDEKNPGYKILFGKYINGYDVELVSDTISDYIEISVYNEEVGRFSQLFRGKNSGVLSYYEIGTEYNIENVVRDNIDEINEKLFGKGAKEYMNMIEIFNNIQDAKIVYMDDFENEEMSLAWRITINDKDLYFEIKDRW